MQALKRSESDSRTSELENFPPFKVYSEDGIEYTVDVFKASVKNLADLWTETTRHKVLLSDVNMSDFNAFTKHVLNPSTILLTVNDVGTVSISELMIGHKARAHYFFWDRKSAGRHRLILFCLNWAFTQFRLQRIDITVPRYAYSALHRIYKIGFRFEGIERKSILFEGKWHDMLRFGILREELTQNTIARGYLEQDFDEKNWFGMLKYDKNLMKYVARERG